MSLVVTLVENCNGITAGRDCITLIASVISPITIGRSPIIIAIPTGAIVGIDLGVNNATIGVSGVADDTLTELFVSSTAGFHAGNTLTGSSSLNSDTQPERVTVPTATIVAVGSTSLAIKNLDADNFFVDGETVTGSGGGSATVNKPLATKRRLEQAARYWYRSGQLYLTTRDADYQGYIKGLQFDMMAGTEQMWQFKLTFSEGTQGLLPDPPLP